MNAYMSNDRGGRVLQLSPHDPSGRLVHDELEEAVGSQELDRARCRVRGRRGPKLLDRFEGRELDEDLAEREDALRRTRRAHLLLNPCARFVVIHPREDALMNV